MAQRRRTEVHRRCAGQGASLAACTALRRPWRALIYLDGRDRHLGYFATKHEALAAHADAVRENLGESFLVDQKPIRGVSRATWAKRPGWSAWRACLRVDGQRKHLGYFQTQDEAAAAVDAYLKLNGKLRHVAEDQSSGSGLKLNGKRGGVAPIPGCANSVQRATSQAKLEDRRDYSNHDVRITGAGREHC
jgi:hypothetical protein